jgi:ankyrin repeat protein/nucleoside phosphorylase
MTKRPQDSELEFTAEKRRKTDDALGHSSQEGTESTPLKKLSHDDYTVGWICALSLELTAAKSMLDEHHAKLQYPRDNNAYTLGSICGYNVVITCLPAGIYGTTAAATVAAHMKSSFPSISMAFMVGIGGGVPSKKNDIRLGDVVISIPSPQCSAVIQYDYGKTLESGRFQRTGQLDKPPRSLLKAVSDLRSDHDLEPSRIPTIMREAFEKHPRLKPDYSYPGRDQDTLLDSGSGHVHVETVESYGVCTTEPRFVRRPQRSDDNPRLHYGPIASANQVMKDGKTRNELAQQLGILCFEMEAAGLMDDFQCLVVRGISDYSNAQKHKVFQKYAALAAAAYTKELLSSISANSTISMPKPQNVDPTPILEHRKLVMESLNFEQAESRRATIKKAHWKTCKWLLQQREYLDWLDQNKIMENNGLLWIKGKPGTGKSTIMKFTLTHLEDIMPKESIIISFFFNARGEDLEKTIIGMYRSLLFQLLQKLPKLRGILDSFRLPAVAEQWDIETLKRIFSYAIESLGQQQLLCLVDALDECPEDQIRDMVEFFESLSHITFSNQTRFHVCFSSRHFPHISIKTGLQLILENQDGHSNDITSYISTELKAGKSKQVQEIKAQILEKSSGIFLWVVLVVRILNKEYDKGRIHALKKRLQEIPMELNDLFKDILLRDNQNTQELLLCIQWILYSKRLLKREEFYFATLSGQDPESLDIWEPDEITPKDMERYILNISKGLAEMTRSRTPTVQFIHESVREFLLKEGSLVDIWEGFRDISKGPSHEQLKTCCYNYLRINISEHVPIPDPLPAPKSEEAKSLRNQVNEKYPFLEYAVKHVLEHADDAEENGVVQKDFIENLPLQTWISLNSLIVIHQTHRYSHETSLLYILADRDLPNLIKIQATNNMIATTEKERFKSPVFAALCQSNRRTFKALLTTKYVSFETRSNFPECSSLELDQEIDRLMSLGPVKLRSNFRPLHYTCENGANLITRLLIENGDDIEARDNGGWTPLIWAAWKGHEAVVRLLLEKGADIEARDNTGMTPLIWAARNGHEAVVRLLLEKGADIEARDKDGWTPLIHAARNGHEAVVRLLLEKGADIKARSNSGETPLIWAAQNGREAAVRLLLEKGADIKARSNSGETPLIWAAQNGHETVVRLLLEKGADIEARSNSGKTPLVWAAQNEHEAVVRLLLEKGADIEARDNTRMTPLIWAAQNWHETVVRLLLEKGADIEARSNSGKTPLIWAAGYGHEAAVRLLLEKGADIEARSNSGKTPLIWAEWNGHEAVVRLLLEKGADIEARGNAGKTPLLCLSYSSDSS